MVFLLVSREEKITVDPRLTTEEDENGNIQTTRVQHRVQELLLIVGIAAINASYHGLVKVRSKNNLDKAKITLLLNPIDRQSKQKLDAATDGQKKQQGPLNMPQPSLLGRWR